MKLPLRLKELRRERGDTQDYIAGLLHVKRSTYGEYERGKIRPPAEKLFFLAEHYGVSIDYLLGVSDFRRISPHERYDFAGHVGLFLDWLRDTNSSHLLDGEEMSQFECGLAFGALKSALDTIRAMRSPNNANNPNSKTAGK